MRSIKGQICIPDLKKIIGMVLSSPRKEADPWQALDGMGFEMGGGGGSMGWNFHQNSRYIKCFKYILYIYSSELNVCFYLLNVL